MEKDRNGDAVWINSRNEFERNKIIYDSAILTFSGVKEGDDVYNCSIPFCIGGERFIFGRVEPHHLWATSRMYLFREVSPDVFERVEDAISYQLEDPFVSVIGGELILGGVHVIKSKGELTGYHTYFYRGKKLDDMLYFTTGPKKMKDIRLVQMPDGIGVFSRPNGWVGFTKIRSLDELDDEVIAKADIIDFIRDDGYGGANQCYYLDSGMIGIIGHMVYPCERENGWTERVYVNIAAIFDPENRKTLEVKIIGTRRCYPASERMRIDTDGNPLDDTAFTSGIVMRSDGKVDLYSGLSDALEGRITINNPFSEYGKIVYGGNKLL